ncbi:MAG: hypothetical protein R2726_23400 [Acidimicrobiales bacterium]
MRHGRFDVVHLRIDGDEVSLRYAHLVVAEPEGTDAVQWECIVVPCAFARLSMGAYALAVDTDDGRTLTGDAILVRRCTAPTCSGAPEPGRAHRRRPRMTTPGAAPSRRAQDCCTSASAKAGRPPSFNGTLTVWPWPSAVAVQVKSPLPRPRRRPWTRHRHGRGALVLEVGLDRRDDLLGGETSEPMS